MIVCNSLFNGDCLRFFKSGIVIFIFAENNHLVIFIFAENNHLVKQYICPRHPCWLNSLSLSLSFWLIPWNAEAHWAHSLAPASKTLSKRCTVPSPTQEGAWCLCASAWALRTGLYWLSALTRGYQPLSLSYFLIFDSEPWGSGPLKDQQPGTKVENIVKIINNSANKMFSSS